MGVRDHRPQRKRSKRFANKKQAEIKHCWVRGINRYGVYIGAEDNAAIGRQIREKKAGFIEKQSNNISVWLVEFQGKKIPVIYDRKRKAVVTCLPPEYMVGKTPLYYYRTYEEE